VRSLVTVVALQGLGSQHHAALVKSPTIAKFCSAQRGTDEEISVETASSYELSIRQQ